MELKHAQKNPNILEDDNDSININQVELKQNKNKLDSNTLASTYFSFSSKNEHNVEPKKVSELKSFL